MNRFRARRKAKEQQQTESNSNLDSALGLSFASKSFGKNKKSIPETKPTIDLATALPSSNDLRTSLIMPNLSARFSMLREQDDPSTKIGKANDDSVLFPKRASRLNLFGHDPLSDITEVASLIESVRPRFTQGERTHSFDLDGYDSDGGAGVMNRARPGEGNNLFGGRQKLYKIPLDSSSKSALGTDTSPPDSAGMGGRVIYEKDASLSLFQQHREKEREEQGKKQSRDSHDGVEDDPPYSPTLSFSRDRGTTSSTTSARRRDSTAATSIESQSPSLAHNNNTGAPSSSSSQTVIQPKPGSDRSATLHRKLYGQALYQTNSTHRVAKDALDSLVRPRAASNDRKAHTVSPVKGSSTLNESLSRTRPLPPPSNIPSPGPPPSGSPSSTGNIDATLGDAKPVEVVQGHIHGSMRPLSPPVSDGEDGATFSRSLQPGDRGKATAMGLFNKPSRNFDEQQFSQRQLQMHQGRRSPVLHKGLPTPASTPASPAQHGAELEMDGTSDMRPPAASDAQASAASPIKLQDEELAALESQKTAGSRYSKTAVLSSQVAMARTIPPGDGDEQPSRPYEAIPSIPPYGSPSGTHPAFRPMIEGVKLLPTDNRTLRAKSVDKQHILLTSGGGDRNTASSNDFASHSDGLGLSGLIRTHLRTDSDKSSICPSPSPQVPSESVRESPKSGVTPPSTHDFDRSAQAEATDIQSRMAENAKHFLHTATLLKNRSEGQPQRVTNGEAGRRSQDSSIPRSWQDELQARHHRGGSTETQQEREAFNNELAERRRKVEESLKHVVDVNSASVSPMPSNEPGLAKPGSGFSAMLRSKPSRSKINTNPPCPPVPSDHSAKAIKFLGLGASNPDLGSSKKPREELWKEEEERMLEDFGRRTKPRPTQGSSPTKSFPQASSEPSSSKRSLNDDGERSRQRSVTPAMTRSSARDRSASDVGRRSKSRNGQYRDDLEKAMVEGTGSQAAYAMSNPSSVSIVPQPSIEVSEQPERSASAMSGRYRSNSRANTAGYFESMPLKPLQTSGIPPPSLSARPSPRTPYSANSTPPIFETSPAISNSSTSTLTQAGDGRTTSSLRGRKRSITKNMISDPTFISTTYTVTTVALPPGASLRNGNPDIQPKDASTPAIPFMNPSRRRGRIGTGTSTTHTLLSTLAGRANDSRSDLASPPSAGLPHPEERATFSDEVGEKKPSASASPLRPRPRLRKVSSEGGDMNARARYQALMAGPSPALPTFPVKRGASPPMQMVEGAMF